MIFADQISPELTCYECFRWKRELNVCRASKFVTQSGVNMCSPFLFQLSKLQTKVKRVYKHLSTDNEHDWSVGLVVKYIANDTKGLGFDFQAGQIEGSVANGSPPLRWFCGVQVVINIGACRCG